jgi:hypothetical protein
LFDTVRACSPSLRSHAMATQSLPAMATQAPPSTKGHQHEVQAICTIMSALL